MEKVVSEEQKQPPQPQEYHDVKTLLSWTAPGRPFRKRGKEFYYFVGVIVLLLEFILFFFSQYELMLAVLALTFLSTTLASVPPKNFHYKVSTEGITVEDHFYIWSELYDFYFRTIEGVHTLCVRTHAIIPGELRICLGDLSADTVRKALVRFLPYRELIRPTFMEKSGDWLAKTFPLEATKK